MAIPQYEEHIEPDAAQVTTPEELHPVAAAFGGDIGAALEKGGHEIGERISSLALHFARMNYYRGEAQKADIADNYKQSLHDQIHGDPSNPSATVTYTPSATTPGLTLTTGEAPSNVAPVQEPIERPLGVLNWKGHLANGALDYLDQWHQQASAQVAQQAKGLGLRNLGSLHRDIQNAWVSQRDFVANHEITETNRAQVATFMKGMQIDAENAITAQTPIALGKVLDSIDDRNNNLQSSQYDDNDPQKGIMTELYSNKFKGMAIDNSMRASLRASGGDPTQFQSMLDKLHDDGKISDAIYESSAEHLDKMSKSIISQNEAATKINNVNVSMEAFGLIGQGKFDWSNQGMIDDYASKNPELGNALQTVAESKGQYKPERNDTENRDFQKSVTAIINSSSQEQFSGYMNKLLSSKNGVSQEHMNMIVNALYNHAKSLPVIDGQPNSPITQNTASMAYNALSQWADKANLAPEEKTNLMLNYLDGMAKNVPNKDNYDNAIRQHMMATYPALSSKDIENIPLDIDGKSMGFNKAINFAEGTSQAKAQKYPDRRLVAPPQPKATETPGEAADKMFGKVKDNG